MGICFNGTPEGTRLHLLPTGADRGSPTSSRRRQQSPGLLHLDYSSPSVYKNMGKAKAFPIFLVRRKGLEPPTY